MKAHRVLLLVWLDAGVGAVAGSMLGNAAGRGWLYAGALLGGVVGAWLGAAGAARFGWLPKELRNGAALGGIAGFLVAAPFALTNLHTPITPIAVCAMAGVGALIGAGAARRS